MLVRFPEIVGAPSEEEIEFLKNLNDKLGHYQTYGVRANISGHEWDQKVREYNSNEKIEKAEMDKILGLIGLEKRIVLIPGWVGWQFKPLFSLGHVGSVPDIMGGKAEYVEFLNFKEDQMPKKYTLRSLWKNPIHSEENLSLMDDAAIERPCEIASYYY